MSGLDLGDPIAYLALERHTPVYSSSGDEIGVVDHVLQDDREDVFDGIVIAHRDEHRHLLPHEHAHAFADADQIDAIHERGVTLKISTSEAASLPKPSANPAVMRDDPTVGGDGRLHRKLTRAWDLISGNY
jgi:uncharacterized protein YrrD